MDADHIIVASLINHIEDAKQSGTDERAIGRILRVLTDHAFRHFAREERLLEACVWRSTNESIACGGAAPRAA